MKSDIAQALAAKCHPDNAIPTCFTFLNREHMKKNTKPGIIPSATVAAIGRAAFGDHWQASLAVVLKVDERAVRRWTNDGCPIALSEKLRPLLQSRAEDIQKMIEVLEDLEEAEAAL